MSKIINTSLLEEADTKEIEIYSQQRIKDFEKEDRLSKALLNSVKKILKSLPPNQLIEKLRS